MHPSSYNIFSPLPVYGCVYLFINSRYIELYHFKHCNSSHFTQRKSQSAYNSCTSPLQMNQPPIISLISSQNSFCSSQLWSPASLQTSLNHACSHLWTFALVVPSAWEPLSPDFCKTHSLTSKSAQMSPSQWDPPIYLHKIATTLADFHVPVLLFFSAIIIYTY